MARQKSRSHTPRSFICAQCGASVTTSDTKYDGRKRFCSALCERRYWRKSKNYPKNKIEVTR